MDEQSEITGRSELTGIDAVLNTLQRTTDELGELVMMHNQDVKVIQSLTQRVRELEAQNLQLCTVIANDETGAMITAEASMVLAMTDENKRLREALEKIAAPMSMTDHLAQIITDMKQIARRALKGSEHE